MAAHFNFPLWLYLKLWPIRHILFKAFNNPPNAYAMNNRGWEILHDSLGANTDLCSCYSITIKAHLHNLHPREHCWTWHFHGHSKGNWQYLGSLEKTRQALCLSKPSKYCQVSLLWLLLLPRNHTSLLLGTEISNEHHHLVQLQDGWHLLLKSLHPPIHPSTTMDHEQWTCASLQSGPVEECILDSLARIRKELQSCSWVWSVRF